MRKGCWPKPRVNPHHHPHSGRISCAVTGVAAGLLGVRVAVVGAVAFGVGAAKGAGVAHIEGNDGGASDEGTDGGAGGRSGKTFCLHWRENPASLSLNSLKLSHFG
jgi:hypothetical protein